MSARLRQLAARAGTCAVTVLLAVMLAPPATAIAVPDFDGAGYYVYVCQAAASRGYSPPLAPAAVQVNDRPGQFVLENSCDSWTSGVPGALVARYQPGTGDVPLPNPGGLGDAAAFWSFAVDKGEGLSLTRTTQWHRVRGFWLQGAGAAPDAATNLNGFDMHRTSSAPATAFGDFGYLTCRNVWVERPNGASGDSTLKYPMSGSFCDEQQNQTWAFNPMYGPYEITMKVSCSTGSPGPKYCRYFGLNWRADLYSAQIYVQDDTNPTVALGATPYGDEDPDYNNDGVPDETKEDFPIAAATDNSGIRRLDFLIDGRPIDSRMFACDHRYMAPCPGATGATPPPGTLDLSPFSFDVDQLDPSFPHTATLVATDGAGRVSTRSAPVTPSRCSNCYAIFCNAYAPTSILTGAKGASCELPGAPAPGEPAPDATDIQAGSGGTATAPTAASAIFEYDLALNDAPQKRPLDLSDCRTIHAVVNGSGAGGALSNTEMNQVVSVTVDLEGFATGREIGQQSLKTTFSVPARATSEYREALGCPA